MASGMSAAVDLADRLAVVPCLGERELLQVLLHPVGDLVEDVRAFGRARAAPGVLGGVRGVESGLDVRRVGAGDLADRLAGDRRDIVEIFAGFGRPPLAADVVVVTLGERGFEGDVEIDFGHALLPLNDAAQETALTARVSRRRTAENSPPPSAKPGSVADLRHSERGFVSRAGRAASSSDGASRATC